MDTVWVRVKLLEVIHLAQVSAARPVAGKKRTKQVRETAKRAAIRPESGYVDLNLTREGGRRMVLAQR